MDFSTSVVTTSSMTLKSLLFASIKVVKTSSDMLEVIFSDTLLDNLSFKFFNLSSVDVGAGAGLFSFFCFLFILGIFFLRFCVYFIYIGK